MRKVAAAIGAISAALALSGSAFGHPIKDSHWRKLRTQSHARASVAAPCPFDGPERMFTIINAGVTGVTLTQIAAIEQATRDESFALRMYYGTPCARFGPGGTPVYLSDGYQALSGGASTYQLGGNHTPSAIYVETGLTPYTTWVRAFTHEVMEDLVNPEANRYFGNYFAEVCDPVENWTYEVDQLRVTDFVTPAWYSGSPVGPWDAAHALGGPA